MLHLSRAILPAAARAALRTPFSARMVLNVRLNSNEAPSLTPKEMRDQKRADHAVLHDAMRDWQAPVIAYEQLKPKTDSPDPNDYLIDVREPDEVILGAIPSSVNLPLSEIKTALAMPEDQFKTKYGFDKPKRDQEIIFYCRSGKRSASAGDVAIRNGYEKVLNYQGSWLDWTSRHPQN